jgi:hypothetical protein
MIVAASPALECDVETIKALEFASVARKIELHTAKPQSKSTPYKNSDSCAGGISMQLAMTEQQLHHDVRVTTIVAQVAAVTVACRAEHAAEMAAVDAARALEWSEWEGELAEQQVATDAAVGDAVQDAVAKEQQAAKERLEVQMQALRLDLEAAHSTELDVMQRGVEEAKTALGDCQTALEACRVQQEEEKEQAATRLSQAVQEERAKSEAAASEFEEVRQNMREALAEKKEALANAGNLAEKVQLLEGQLASERRGATAALESAMHGRESEIKREHAEEMKTAIASVLEATLKTAMGSVVGANSSVEALVAPLAAGMAELQLVGKEKAEGAETGSPTDRSTCLDSYAEERENAKPKTPGDLQDHERENFYTNLCAKAPFAWAHGSGLVVASMSDRRTVIRKGVRGSTYHDGELWVEELQHYEREQYLVHWEGIGMVPEWQEASLVQMHGTTKSTMKTADDSDAMSQHAQQPTHSCTAPTAPLLGATASLAIDVETLPLQPLGQQQQGRRRASTRVKFIKCMECAGWEVSAAPPNASSVDLCTCLHQAGDAAQLKQPGKPARQKPRREIGSRGRRSRCSTSSTGRASRMSKRRSGLGRKGMIDEDEENIICHPNSPRQTPA